MEIICDPCPSPRVKDML